MENKQRLTSLDALRGFDMMWIMGFSGAVVALCALFGFPDCWVARQMSHVAWHGFRHHDTIFPMFLFIAGVAWPFSYASQVSRGVPTVRIVLKCLRRLVLLFILGLTIGHALDFNFATYRYDSILAHIGVCWIVAALLYVFIRNWKVRLIIAFALLVLHWLVLYSFTAPDASSLLTSGDPKVMQIVASYAAYGTDGFSFTGNIAGWMDRNFMPGRLYEVVFDPDGLFSKVSGISLAIFGVLAGELLRDQRLSGNCRTLLLAGAGAISLVLMFAWMPLCPVNKKIWTSTFILSSASYSLLLLALFYWIIDVKGYRRWAFFFKVIGVNSITIYMLMRFFDFGSVSGHLLGGVASLGNGHWSDLVLAFGQVAVEWLILWGCYRKGVFLKV